MEKCLLQLVMLTTKEHAAENTGKNHYKFWNMRHLSCQVWRTRFWCLLCRIWRFHCLLCRVWRFCCLLCQVWRFRSSACCVKFGDSAACCACVCCIRLGDSAACCVKFGDSCASWCCVLNPESASVIHVASTMSSKQNKGSRIMLAIVGIGTRGLQLRGA